MQVRHTNNRCVSVSFWLCVFSGWSCSLWCLGLCHVLLLPPFQQPGSCHAAAQCKETRLWPLAVTPQVCILEHLCLKESTVWLQTYFLLDMIYCMQIWYLSTVCIHVCKKVSSIHMWQGRSQFGCSIAKGPDTHRAGDSRPAYQDYREREGVSRRSVR